MNFFIRNLSNYFLRSRPFEMTIFLTSLCNFRCTHCFYWKKLGNKEQLTLEEFKKIARGMPSVERLIFTGGEPFLREDIDEIVSEFYKYCNPLYITIPTNGYFTDRMVEKVKKILTNARHSFINISLSVDEIGDKREEMVKVRGSSNRLVETARELKRLQSKFHNLGVTAICTQTAENENRLDQIYDYAVNELNIDNFGFAVARGNPKNPDVVNIDPQKYYQMYHKLLESSSKNNVPSSRIPFYKLFLANRQLVYKYTYRTLIQQSYQLKCFAGILRAVVLENGDVYPCEVLMDDEGFLIGNLKDFDMNFMKMWNSKKKQDVIQKISKKKCFCTHGCDMTVNILFNRKLPLKILKNFFSKKE